MCLQHKILRSPWKIFQCLLFLQLVFLGGLQTGKQSHLWPPATAASQFSGGTQGAWRQSRGPTRGWNKQCCPTGGLLLDRPVNLQKTKHFFSHQISPMMGRIKQNIPPPLGQRRCLPKFDQFFFLHQRRFFLNFSIIFLFCFGPFLA